MFEQFLHAISDFIHDNWMKVLTGFVLMGLGWYFGKRKARSDWRKREFLHRLRHPGLEGLHAEGSKNASTH